MTRCAKSVWPDFAGGVVDDEVREIGLAGHRAQRGEFGYGEADEIKLARARIGHIIEDGRLGSGRKFARLAVLFRRARCLFGLGHCMSLVRFIFLAHVFTPFSTSLLLFLFLLFYF